MKLSVLIPVFNEEATLATVIQAVRTTPLPVGIELEVVVVNDGSTDGSATVLSLFVGRPGVKVFHQDCNRGKAEAVRRAIREATGEVLLVQDADLEYHPREYVRLLGPFLEGKADVVYGSRFLGSIERMKSVNRLANVFSNLTFNLLFGTHLTDINTCLKLFRAEDVRTLNLVADHFAIETEVTAKLAKKGLRIVEVPIDYKARSIKEGKKMNWLRALGMYWAIIRFRFFF